MARPSTPLSAQLARLDAAKKRADALGTRATVSFKSMAEILGVTRQTLTNWTDALEGFEQSGCYKRGGNGIEWEFKPVRTVNWLLKHFTKKAEKARRATDNFAKDAGANKSFSDANSPQELKQFYELSRAIRRDKLEDGEHSKTQENKDLHEGFAELVRSAVMSQLTRFDPNGNEDSALRSRIDEMSRSTLVLIYEGGVELARRHRENIQREGFTSADS